MLFPNKAVLPINAKIEIDKERFTDQMVWYQAKEDKQVQAQAQCICRQGWWKSLSLVTLTAQGKKGWGMDTLAAQAKKSWWMFCV